MNRTLIPMVSGAFKGLLPVLLGMLSAQACQICLPMPTESLADRVLSAEHLMLAREHPERPYHLQSVGTLKGDLAQVPPADVFLDSSTRRKLSNHPEMSLLCGWFGQEQGWRRIATHDDTLAPVVATILDRAEEWKADPDARTAYFANFLGNDDSELSDLAHLEVARASYSKLLAYADRIPREQLHEKLKNLRRMKWHALYILFLGKSDDPRDHEFIRKGVTDSARYGLATRTAAFATALIEIDGPAAIDRLTELYLGESERRPEELAALHATLMTHGNEGTPELRDALVAAYGKLLARAPSLAPDLADDLTRWQRYDHAEAFSALLAETTPDLTATARIRNHLRASASVSKPSSTIEPGNTTTVLAVAGGLLLIPLLLAFNGRSKQPQAA
ncbi:hypothetical protein HAHE_35530 [Haloferula helveola]|uniref:Uncharacterized protein n=1 Tax=Haloferula helveola TaxID=490095 RepID=A0ABM7RIR3_9BACT|nr:hypothetical protein HAHE_35530 [Haloferula helveola]